MKQDELLNFYQDELAFMRQLGVKFSEAHPKIAGRLRLNPNSIEDPHVARLIESVALSNARVRQKLEDDFPQISDALLQTLHPNALSPIPAMAISQFQFNRQNLVGKKTIPADSLLFSEPVQGQPCQFKTRYPVQLVPLEILEVKLITKPATMPIIAATNNCPGALRLTLGCTHHSVVPDKLEIDDMRFFINAPTQYAHAVYELLFQRTVAIAIADSPTDSKPLLLDPQTCLKRVGFDKTEGMLPYNKRIFMGYRLLSEFFALPEKFLFFDLIKLEQAISQKLNNSKKCFEIYFYLKQLPPGLDKKITADYFALGCTPIVNLFDQKAEPITLTNSQTEYNLLPNVKQSPETIEIYAVNQVTATTFNSEKVELLPFYGLKHYRNASYYHLIRKPAWEAGHYPMRGTEVFLTFSDMELSQFNPDKWIINANISCTNRDLPEQLVFDADSPGLKTQPLNADFIAKITCITPMTPARRPFMQHNGRWRYVSHLTLNHLSVIDDEDAIDALRGMLQLYDFDQTDEHLNLLEGLLSISSKTIFIRSPASHRGNPFWHGVEINLVVDETKFSGDNLYLFGCVLSHFFCLYVTVNLFTQLVIKNSQREIYRFAPMAGNKAII